MNSMNRRDLCVALSSFAAMAAASAQAPQAPRFPPDEIAGEAVLSMPQAFRFGDLHVTKSGNGESRAVIRGVLPTGESVELHETTLLPGHMPHPPHKHRHSEFMMIREGQLEFDNDGTPERVGPGGVVFAASNVMHGLKNVGEAPANYFVIAIGRETPAQQV